MQVGEYTTVRWRAVDSARLPEMRSPQPINLITAPLSLRQQPVGLGSTSATSGDGIDGLGAAADTPEKQPVAGVPASLLPSSSKRVRSALHRGANVERGR